MFFWLQLTKKKITAKGEFVMLNHVKDSLKLYIAEIHIIIL